MLPEPRLPDNAFKTYWLSAPAATHRRRATCEEVGCLANRNGWAMGFTTTVDAHARALKWIRFHSGLSYTIEQVGDKITLTFAAGQQCLKGMKGSHTVLLDREPFYIVRSGDWRTERRDWNAQPRSAADWIDDFGSHQQGLADRQAQG